MKTYSAESGRVYQYTFAGQRTIAGAASGTEYAFDVSGEQPAPFRISVLVADAAVQPWITTNGRELAAGERYAVAKISLQRYLDAREPGAGNTQISPGSEAIESILDELGV